MANAVVKNKDIIENCIYIATGYNTHFIFKCGTNGGWKFYIEPNKESKHIGPASDQWYWDGYVITHANTEQGDWLLRCEEAGKFLPQPKNEVVNNYSIF